MRKKSSFLAVFFLFLVAFSVYATEDYEKQVYSGTVAAGEAITTADNKTFAASFGGNPDKISIEMPSGYGLVVSKGLCEVNDYYDICFDSTSFWYHNYTLDKDYYKAAIKIYEVLAQLSLTRTIEKTSFLIGEETKIDAAIENKGGRAASDIAFADEFPASFAIMSIEGCSLEGNSIAWKGSLDMNGKKECSYTIKALEKITYTSKAKASYNDGSALKELTDSKTITIPDYQLSLASSLEDTVEVGGEIELGIDLINMHNSYEINVIDFYVEIPPKLQVTESAKLFDQDYNKYKWNGVLTPLEKRNFYLKLKGSSVGSYKVIEYAEFIINNIRKKVQKEFAVKVTGPVLSIDSNIRKKSLKSGEKSDIIIEATNPSSKYFIKNIELAIESDIPDFQDIKKAAGNLEAGRSRTIFDSYFTAPNVTEAGTYYIEIKASYESDFGKGETKSKEEISILPGAVEEKITSNVSEWLITSVNATGEDSTKEENATKRGEDLTFKSSGSGFFKSIAGVGLITLIIIIFLIIFIAERRHKHIDFFRRKLNRIKSSKEKIGKLKDTKKEREVIKKERIAEKLKRIEWKKRIMEIKEKIRKKEAPVKEKIEEEIEKIKERVKKPEVAEEAKETREEKTKGKEMKEELEELEKTGRDIREHEKTKFRF